ncbi:MAG TPA: hypothetical protein VKY22_15665 [Bradyrhizobium sp.]|nr:hypothetical protein [Bradyrhizobium sp.]
MAAASANIRSFLANGVSPYCHVMARHILLKCPATGMHVQHWLADEPDAAHNSYRQMVCPACTRIHFVNPQTGKLVGEK